ncbi:MAG: phosphate ABC transporter permease subunit PstC [Candidatus Puniceispirillum sp.]|jgi:phosphate transport system permease protein|nr:phosphate ABC transporter permease subunit PstC [Candidatus Puniceispirillum sp.]MDP4632484.1 phosphate ABC transporter permease subunit PstC [Porticoccaceae bacterium]
MSDFLSPNLVVFAATIAAAFLSFYLGTGRVRKQAIASQTKSHSLNQYYGFYVSLWVLVPAILLALIWMFAADPMLTSAAKARMLAAYPNLPDSFLNLKMAQLVNIAAGYIKAPDAVMAAQADLLRAAQASADRARSLTLAAVMCIGFFYAFRRVSPELRARVLCEAFLRRLFFLSAVVAILTTIGIVASLLFEAVRFFREVSLFDFFFGTHWSPMTALRPGDAAAADEFVAGSTGSFGMVPVMAGTLLVAVIAMAVAVPIGLFSAIYTSEFASRRVRNIVKPTLEVLAGVPTVVYGFFAALTAAPFFRDLGLFVGLDVSSQSALAAGGVMGIMIIPFISSLSDDVITAVPQSLRDGAYGLGSTRGETIIRVVLPAAFPGLVGAFLLAISRAIGETMIVVMAAGVAANMTINPLESVTTVTVQIVMLLTGDNEFDSVKTLSAFALGMTLFVITLLLNVAALTASRRLGQRYE